MWHLFFIVAQIGLSFYIISTLYLLLVYFIKSKTQVQIAPKTVQLNIEHPISIVFNTYCSENDLFKHIQDLNNQEYRNYTAYFFVDEPMVIYNGLENIKIIRPLQKRYSSFGLLNLVKNYIPDNPEAVLVVNSSSKIKEGTLAALNQNIQKGFEVVQCNLVASNNSERLSNYQAISLNFFNLIDRKAMQSSGLSAALWGSGFMLNYNLFCELDFESYQQNDKALQAELLKKSIRISFEPEAQIIEKTYTEQEFAQTKAKSFHLYLYNFKLGFNLLLDGILNPSFNKIIFGFNYLRPPLIVMLFASVSLGIIDLYRQPKFEVFLWVAIIGTFISALFLMQTGKAKQLIRPITLSIKILLLKLIPKKSIQAKQNSTYPLEQKLS
ncbi:MAG: hypothetical protein CFE21_05380 [Bacteroidetes bacterium B1(2017)]|nr:MAG: hypothetical protein CFE21_05380 [Bacteroidetes bacterium B1(2017)]